MTIEINEKGSPAFYDEVVNVQSQIKGLMQRPDAPLKNNFKSLVNYIWVCGGLLIMLAVMCIIARRIGIFQVAGMVLMAANIILSSVVLRNMKYASNRLMEEQKPRVLVMDEKGVELSGEGTVSVSIPWPAVAFVRTFSQSVCFIPASVGGVIISVDKKYRDQIMGWIRENGINVRLIG